jgi:hypothetical protein
MTACGSGSSLAVWPTALAQDGAKSTRRRQGGPDLKTFARAALWPTPATDSFRSRGGERKDEMGLDQLARRSAIWSTPRATDGAKGGSNLAFGAGVQSLPAQAAQNAIRGDMPSGSNAPTESSGALNPAWVCWLMGYPNGWLD